MNRCTRTAEHRPAPNACALLSCHRCHGEEFGCVFKVLLGVTVRGNELYETFVTVKKNQSNHKQGLQERRVVVGWENSLICAVGKSLHF